MIKNCKFCGRKFIGNGRQKYCPGGKCKKNFENSLRSRASQSSVDQASPLAPSDTIRRPAWLNDVAVELWDKLAPELISIGVLNVRSEDMFAEFCDLNSRLIDINREINTYRTGAVAGQPEERSKALGTGLYDAKGDGLRESVLSELKRKYSKHFLEYLKELNLTPRGNQLHFGNNAEHEEADDTFD